MIYTVTFNPSLDYYVKVNNLKTGAVNRTSSERLTVGGKGINISLALQKLGDKSVALGFVAGFTGREILSEIEALGIEHDLIEVAGRSRINVKIKSTAETDVNGAGADITELSYSDNLASPRGVIAQAEEEIAQVAAGDLGHGGASLFDG